MSTLPIYLVGLAGPALERCVAALPGALPVGDRHGLAERDPGLVLLSAEGCDVAELARLADALDPSRWTVCLVGGEGASWIRSVSVGRPEGLDAIALHAGDPAATPGTLLSLEPVLVEISRARHEINNPLTSALAETQILLMDAPEGETRDALLQIQTQLRRIRDLLIATRHLRPGG